MVTAPAKAPPVGVQEYDFSYSVSTGKFRWRLGEDQWLCNRIAGQVWIRFANSKTHHIDLVCELAIDEDGAATVWAPEGKVLEALRAEPVIKNFTKENLEDIKINEAGLKPLAEFPQGRYSHWRVCSVNWEDVWRLRDERSTEVGGELYVVNGYRGLANFNWMDGSSHVFADNTAEVDEYGIVHFG